jgi:MerR family transcriptional regulator, redox-sensitive transcriptional activator SoxR
MSHLRIGDVARDAGLRTSALRYYERAGLLPAARRIAGQRRYDGSALRTLAVIKLAQEAGFTVAEVRTLLHGFSLGTPPPARWRALARRKRREIDDLLGRARRMRRLLDRLLRCECPSLDDCGNVIGSRRKRHGGHGDPGPDLRARGGLGRRIPASTQDLTDQKKLIR